MGTQLWWIYDVLVIAIVLRVIYSNASRGMTKVLIVSIGYIFATVAASLLSAPTADVLYESAVMKTNITAIENANRKTDFAQAFSDAINAQMYGVTCDRTKAATYLLPPDTDQFDEKLYQYLNRQNDGPVSDWEPFSEMIRSTFVTAYGEQLDEYLPAYVRANFEECLAEKPALMKEMLTVFFDSHKTDAEIAEYMEEQFDREPATQVVRIFTYLMYFSIIMVIAAIIAAAQKNKLFFNVRKSTECIFGGMLGLLEAGAMLVLMTLAVRLLVLLGGGNLLCLNDETIANSKVFCYLYDNISMLL